MRKSIAIHTNDSLDRDVATSKANINDLDKKQLSLFEIRNVLVSELSDVICRDTDGSFDDLLSRYESIFDSAENQADRSIEKYLDSLSTLDKINFCRAISSSKRISQEILKIMLGEDEKISPDAKGRVAYMKNHYTDAAYLAFSKAISSPRSYYSTSFQSVCEEVYTGACEYCILPIESSLDGKLMSFYSMIDKYELKINSVYVVKSADGQSFTKFALLGKSFSSGIFNASSVYLNKRNIEIRVSQTSISDSPLDSILLAARACSLRTQRIDSLPLSYNENLLGYYVVLGINHVDFKAFLTYLAFEHPQCYIVGIYSNVN